MTDDFLQLHGNNCATPNQTGGDVPVFNCHVLLSGPDESGKYQARAANLPGIVGGGATQRQALLSVSTAFKATVADLHRNGEPIPWIDPPDSPRTGEIERWIPVHL